MTVTVSVTVTVTVRAKAGARARARVTHEGLLARCATSSQVKSSQVKSSQSVIYLQSEALAASRHGMAGLG